MRMIHQIVLAPETKSRRARTIFVPAHGSGHALKTSPPPHDGAPGSPHSKQKTPLNPQFQCSRPPALSRSTAGKPILEPTPPNPGAPGSPHSKQKIPLNPQFQCSPSPALPKSTAGKPILEPAPPNPGAPGSPQSEQQIPLPPGQSVDLKLLSPKHRFCIRARLQPCRYRTRKTGALAPEARTPK
jgi:hypothetical protein